MGARDLTVVIPTVGRWPALRRTLDALGRQTAVGFSVVVVLDGEVGEVPGWLRDRAGVRVLPVARGGPGAARNAGVAASAGELLLFLGDDIVPEPGVVAGHVAAHAAAVAPELAVLGHVRWARRVAWRPVNRWLDWSGTQFDYRQLARESGGDAGFGRFYSAHVSLRRSLFTAAGGFDEAFTFAYEDLDFGWRAAQAGMVLRYRPELVAEHHHGYSVATLRGRFTLIGEGERRMAARHRWFTPWFSERIERHAAEPPAAGIWGLAAAAVPESLERAWWPVAVRADRHYHQAVAEPFRAGWDRALDLEELEAYLGDGFSREALHRHLAGVAAEVAAIGDEARFYRESRAYLYDLTAFALSGTKLPYLDVVRELVPAGARLLDYGCGIGADGLRLLRRGYRVEFADFANPSVAFLRWRLARRGIDAAVHDLDAGVPGGFVAAYAFDVIEHVPDPWAFLRELEARAELVIVNLLEPAPDDPPIHHALPIAEILAHARRRGLRVHKRFHGRSHLIAYRGGPPY